MTDTVWMITRQRRAPDERIEFWYSPPASSAYAAWASFTEWEVARNGANPYTVDEVVAQFKREGWRARRVTLTLAGRYSLRWYS